MVNNSKANIFTALTILFWATSATVFKIALKHVSSFQLLFYSVLFSTITLFIILLIQGKVYLLKKSDWQSVLKSAALGFLNPFLYYIILFEAYDLLPGQIAMSLNYGWPIALMLLSVPILGQSLSARQVLAVLISFSGVVLIAAQGEYSTTENVSYFGVVLALSSTLIWAIFWLVNTKDDQGPVVKLFIGFCFGLFYTVLVSPLFGGIELLATEAWLPVAYIGLFEMGVTFVIWLMALKLSSSAARVGNLIYLTPFLSLLVLNFVIGEEIFLSTFLGLVLIVTGIIFQAIGKK